MNKIIGIIVLFSTISGCGTQNLKELNLTYVKAPLNIPAIINNEKGFFSKKVKPTKVYYHEINSGAQQTEAMSEKPNNLTTILKNTFEVQQTDAMANKTIDIATVLGSTSAILAASQGNDLKIIGMFSRAPKEFKIMTANPNLTNIKTLRGKKVGGPTGTILYQLLITALKKEGMTTNDIQFYPMKISQALSGILNSDLDAALLGGAATSMAKKAGAYVIVNGKGLVDGATVIAVRGELLKNHEKVIKKYLSSHHESLIFMKTNPEATYLYTSSQVGLTSNQVKSIIEDYDFNPTITAQDISNLNSTQDFLFEEGILERKIDIDNLISPLAQRSFFQTNSPF